VVDILRVNVPTIAQRDADLGLEHRQVKQSGNTMQSALATGAESQVRARIAGNQIIIDNLRYKLGGKIAIEDAGIAWLDYLDQGFSVAEANTANLNDISLNMLLRQLRGKSGKYTFSACCSPTGAHANQDTDFVALLHCFPLRNRFASRFLKVHHTS
jgi:hypothetical protein